MKVEIWSDVMCPFCYIGKRYFEAALKQFTHQQELEVVWKSFQLDPTIPEVIEHKQNVYEYLAQSKGISVEQSVSMHERVREMAANAGLHYNFDKLVVANSFKIHRMIQYAKTHGLGDTAEEVFFEAYFINGKDLADTQTLISLGEQIGLTKAQVNEALTNDEFAYAVKQDIMEAQSLGISSVPFFVFDRKYGIAGAQPIESFIQTLNQSYEEWAKTNHIANLKVQNGPACSTDGHCE
ncbi:MAG: DsbA family oxidoreductase [Bacteroidia bacterium]|nr:DsbA family oxidoreductase [Bacteroidia bacterium]